MSIYDKVHAFGIGENTLVFTLRDGTVVSGETIVSFDNSTTSDSTDFFGNLPDQPVIEHRETKRKKTCKFSADIKSTAMVDTDNLVGATVSGYVKADGTDHQMLANGVVISGASAKASDGKWDVSGEILCITAVAAPAAAPVISAPVDASNSNTLPVTAVWAAVSGATSYTVQVSTINTFASYMINQVVTAATLQLAGLAAGTEYFIRAKANNAGGASAWSSTISFTTAA